MFSYAILRSKLPSTTRLWTPMVRLLTSTSNSTNVPLFDMENPFEKEKRKCILCQHNVIPNYKNVKLLSQFQSPYTGRIYGKHITGLCAEKQAQVELEISKAQKSGLMAVYLKEPCFIKDPKLFDSENPIRPHRFE
ncbi:hypothetical protein PPYR_04572 [Photinus pyralis]|uniref:28S ribosomal protein S18c, mitochondrial n=1 Tax=Photinus pyralis TaxID=7054 RepID=A0A5N4AYI9_PHOPY|nr:28S ribosomal protein S18c, mitochondrial [Photinus pyralis]KAB0802386.1 hypothetical protein PPYR_04572 [Photinus pyralis]